jgi:UDP-N-acetylmuramyl tripeptide synthase
VFVDFAHNLAGFAAVLEVVRSLAQSCEQGPALCFGMAGDRSDAELRELGAALMQFEPSWVILREQPDYMRGRELGEVPALIEQGLRGAGFDPDQISLAADEPSSIERALELGAELIVILVHTQRVAVVRCLQARAANVDSIH